MDFFMRTISIFFILELVAVLSFIISSLISYYSVTHTATDASPALETKQLVCNNQDLDKCIKAFKTTSPNYKIDHLLKFTNDAVVFSIIKDQKEK